MASAAVHSMMSQAGKEGDRNRRFSLLYSLLNQEEFFFPETFNKLPLTSLPRLGPLSKP
jgi:hypothetical protein